MSTPLADQIDDIVDLELAAAATHFGVNPSQLADLLPAIVRQPVARAQVQDLLEQAYTQWQALRTEIAEDLLHSLQADATDAVAAALSALEDGANFSLQAADEALDSLYQHGRKSHADAAAIAAVRAAQAAIASIEIDWTRAATRLAEAAATPGLAPEVQHHYRCRQAAALTNCGREFADNTALQAAAEIYTTEIAAGSPTAGDAAVLQARLGGVYGLLGQRQRGTALLERALQCFEQALTALDRSQSPDAWAAAQNGLGNTLGALGQRQRDEALLEQSVAAFKAALTAHDEETTSPERATSQNNLAAALQTLGQLKKDAKRLKRAVDAYQAVLGIWSRERKPLVWAATMNHLGTALRLLGERRKGPRTLEQSIAAYNAALSLRTRTRLPRAWAMTQNDLGATLKILGERNEDPQLLGKSVAAFRDSLKELHHDAAPVSWAMTMANLGVARRQLAEHSGDLAIAQRACEDIMLAVKAFRSASHAQFTELGEEQLSLARKLVAALQAEPAR